MTVTKIANKRIVIIDDHPVVREGLAVMLGGEPGLEFAGEAMGVEDGLRLIERERPDAALIDLLERAAVLPSLRTLIKARQWQLSNHLDVVEELLSECQLPGEVNTLIHIMTHHPEREWCKRYVEETGMTDRTYRRHKHVAAQIVECWETENPCPNVRAGAGVGALAAVPDNRTAHPGSPVFKISGRPATQVAKLPDDAVPKTSPPLSAIGDPQTGKGRTNGR